MELAINNPKSFLDIHPWPLIIDEVQRAPGILNEIKKRIDEQRDIWLRTNSDRELMYIISSLFNPDVSYLLEKENNTSKKIDNINEIFDLIFLGGMPDVVTGVSDRDLYYKSYIETYIEKDVKKLISASSELQFRKFLSLIALRTAQEINFADLSRSVGIDVETCKRWISILETSGIIIMLEPFMANLSKRVIKSPKLFFMDTGICAYLCKWPTILLQRHR